MNLQQPNANDATQTSNRSRSVVPGSGLCTRCIDGCRGNCEVFKATFRGREVIYPGPFGEITAGGDKDYPVDYSHLNIQGYALGAKGLPEGVAADPDTAIFPDVNTETEYGWDNKVKMRLPIFTGALGSTEIARKNWEHFAVGAAISGITLVCGENVCGIDPELELDSQRQGHERARTWTAASRSTAATTSGYGDILVQMNVEDTRLGVAEYVIEKHGLETIELKWGQGAKCIGGEIKVDSPGARLELQKRGYIVTPDPSDPVIQAAFKDGAIKRVRAPHPSRLRRRGGFHGGGRATPRAGLQAVTLKTGAYRLRELAMAIKWGCDAKIDLLTIDGAPGGTGMSPWRMMEEWGIPSFYLQSAANEFAGKLTRSRAERVPDIALPAASPPRTTSSRPWPWAPLRQGGLHGPGADDPGHGRQEHRRVDEQRRAAQDRRPVSALHPRRSSSARKRSKTSSARTRCSDIPLGAVGIYTYVEKIKVGPAAADGRRAVLQHPPWSAAATS